MVRIVTEGKKGGRTSGKPAGRSFSARLLGSLDVAWEARGQDAAVDPSWIAFFGSEAELRPFVANAQAGRKFKGSWDTFATPKRSGYRWLWQKVPGGAAAVAYRPDLFHLEPTGQLADPLRFVLAPARRWLERQVAELAVDSGDASYDPLDAARATLFAAFLDRRSPVPILRDLRFHLRIFRAASEDGWLRRTGKHGDSPSWIRPYGLEALGLDDPAAVSVAPEELQDFLVRETQEHFLEFPQDKRARLVPMAPPIRSFVAVPVQLGFDFGLPGLAALGVNPEAAVAGSAAR